MVKFFLNNMRKIILIIFLIGNIAVNGFAQLNIEKLEKFWIWVDKDKNIGSFKFKKSDMLFVEKQHVHFGSDSININKFGDNFTLIDTAYTIKNNFIFFVKNNVDSSIWINNKLDSASVLKNFNNDTIKTGYSKLTNDSLLFFYADSVVKWKEKDPTKTQKAKANVCIFFKQDSLKYEYIIERGIDSTLMIQDTLSISDTVLKVCYEDSVLLQCGFASDSISLYYKNGNTYWIFDKNKLPVQTTVWQEFVQWVKVNGQIIKDAFLIVVLLLLLILFFLSKKKKSDSNSAKYQSVGDLIKYVQSLLDKKTDNQLGEDHLNKILADLQGIETVFNEEKKSLETQVSNFPKEKENAVNKAKEKKDEECKAKIKEKENEIIQLKKDHKIEIEGLKETQKKEIGDLKETQKKEIEGLKETQKKEIEGLKETQKKEIGDLKEIQKKAEIESQRYRKNVSFADELKPYAEQVLVLMDMGNKLQSQCNNLYIRKKDNTSTAPLLNKAFAKFQSATYNLKVGDWREQLNAIVHNGTLIMPPAGKENNHSSAYATIRQAIKEGKNEQQRAEEFQKDIAIALLNQYCSALLVLIEDIKALSENKETKFVVPESIQQLRSELRAFIQKELALKINDIALLEKLQNNSDIDVMQEKRTNMTADESRVIEVLSYGIGRERVEPTKVIISK
jgi:hypothetical protein